MLLSVRDCGLGAPGLIFGAMIPTFASLVIGVDFGIDDSLAIFGLRR